MSGNERKLKFATPDHAWTAAHAALPRLGCRTRFPAPLPSPREPTEMNQNESEWVTPLPPVGVNSPDLKRPIQA